MLGPGRKRIFGYLLAVAMAAAALVWLHKAPADVKLVVDLKGAALVEGRMLAALVVTVTDADGRWVAASEYFYPEAIYPVGPPLETPPAELKLRKGSYEARLELSYGPEWSRRVVTRRVGFMVEESGLVRVNAGG